MSNMISVSVNDTSVSFFHNYIIPNNASPILDDTNPLPEIFHKVYENSQSSSRVKRHVVANSYAVIAVAIATFSIGTYVVSGIRSFVANILVGDFVKALKSLGSNLLNAGKCLLYVAISIGILVMGIFMPQRIYAGLKPLNDAPDHLKPSQDLTQAYFDGTKINTSLVVDNAKLT